MLWMIAGVLFMFGAVYGVNIMIESWELYRSFHPYGPDRRWVFGKILFGSAIFCASAGGMAFIAWAHQRVLSF